MSEQTMEEYIQEQIDKGYITEEGKPLKCGHCESTELKTEYFYEDHTIMEYEVTCGVCKGKVGLWSYGHWQF